MKIGRFILQPDERFATWSRPTFHGLKLSMRSKKNEDTGKYGTAYNKRTQGTVQLHLMSNGQCVSMDSQKICR